MKRTASSADVDDIEGAWLPRSRESTTTRRSSGDCEAAGRLTAEADADERLDGRWAALLDGFGRRKAEPRDT